MLVIYGKLSCSSGVWFPLGLKCFTLPFYLGSSRSLTTKNNPHSAMRWM